MDILDYLLEYDAAATRQLLVICRDVSDKQWHHLFDFGQGSLYSTFDHFVDSAEYWTTLLQGHSWNTFVPLLDSTRSVEGVSQRFEATSPVFIAVSKQLRDQNRLAETFVDHETGPARRTFGATIAHVTTHNMHHRAQIRIMFDLLDIAYSPFTGFALDAYPL